MNIKELNSREDISNDDKLNKAYSQFGELLNELKSKELNHDVYNLINDSVDVLNSSNLNGVQLIKLLKQKQTAILKQVEKTHKIVPINYYRTLWMVLGMTAFGLPLGVAFGLSVGNIGLLAIGLPIGMGIGVVVGMSMDKRALEEGRQLNIEIKN
ncbi:hypothetical protein [Pedobacter flavus]|uniref:Glycine zipper family protein n=1 Tax=Pedobacter flavus TaxID=3113906 RepID=A0ABU7H1X3_9SPHI|nr:hypothetical protein [Pedobacter sp. VNH31]MEE1885312.1 hypothetical protein [Pedobacter sp. VNH31]